MDDLLNRPNLEDIDYIPVQWKGSMLDSLILPMSWPVFIRIFRYCLLWMDALSYLAFVLCELARAPIMTVSSDQPPL